MNTITISVDYKDHDKVVLTNSAGDTYTSKSEELIDFLHSAANASTPAGEDVEALAEKTWMETHEPHIPMNPVWLRGYKAALQNKVPVECYGLRWVKASERLPLKGITVFCRVGMSMYTAHWDGEDFWPHGYDSDEGVELHKIEWLDETMPNTNCKEGLLNIDEDVLVEFANLCAQYPNEARANLWEEVINNWYTQQ